MDLIKAMILYKASDDFSDRQAMPADPREAFRQGLDDGEVLFARRLRAALKAAAGPPAGPAAAD
jgi:hypothetical protein